MTKRKAVRVLRRIAKKLHGIQVPAAPHISRKDNNQVFEIAFYLEAVAKRIEEGYPDTNYSTRLSG